MLYTYFIEGLHCVIYIDETMGKIKNNDNISNVR